ncbi:hypothetical protein ACFL3V_05115 [Nanoarchaeota archaeon]
MKTMIPNYVSSTAPSELEKTVGQEAPVVAKRPLWQRFAAGLAVAALYSTIALGGVTGCGGNGGNDPLPDSGRPDVTMPDSGPEADTLPEGDSDVDAEPAGNPLDPVDYTTLAPQDGATVTSADSPLAVSMTVPGVPAGYTGPVPSSVDVVITAEGDNGTPSNTADDWSETVADETASLESTVQGSLDLSTANDGGELKDGEKVKFTFNASAEVGGENYERSATSTVTYQKDSDKPSVVNCYVKKASAGAGLGIECEGNDPTGGNLMGNWSVSSSLAGAQIFDTDVTHAQIVKTGGVLSASDVGLHNYSVTCGNGTDTSDPYDFTVPVDLHQSTLTLQCSTATGGTNHILLLPETTIDAIATACVTGHNPANKPDNAGEQDYVGDAAASCVPGAVNSLIAAEKQAHTHYNEGKTVADVYAGCTVDFAQVRYESDM